MNEKALRKKHDDELMELLQELRIGLNGAQVLFAFLLVAPFSSKWEVTRTEKVAYLIALFTTLLALALLIGPMTYHRLRWRQWNKERMLAISNRLAIGGMVFAAISMTASVYLVLSVLTNRDLTIALATLCGLMFAITWFVLPLLTPYDRWDEHLDEPEEPNEPDEADGEHRPGGSSRA